MGKKIKINKNGDGEEYQILGNFIPPCRIEKDKWKMLTDNSDSINAALLRQQQQRLAILKAIKVEVYIVPYLPLGPGVGARLSSLFRKNIKL